MDQRRRLTINSVSGLLHQIVTLICGFVLPRMLLSCFGSEANGMVASISQFLGIIYLADCGVGVVVQSSLYKPLAERDYDQVSRIMVSSERFFRKIGLLLCAYVVLMLFVYPRIINDSFDTCYTISLILAISISFVAQYFIGMSHRMLLHADQRGYVFVQIQTIVLIINTVLSVIMMRCGASLQVIKLMASLIMIVQYLVVVRYCHRRYAINMNIAVEIEPIDQKWNGFAQHMAYVVLHNTDTVVLTLFSTLSNISVYHVYNLVVSGVQQLISASMTGVQAVLGNLYANRDNDRLNAFFDKYEWLLHFVVTWAFVCTWKLLVPFVSVYTLGITDAQYSRPVFGALLVVAQATYCYRLPYVTMILAAGHFKQTQLSSVFEAVINVVTSVLLVKRFGLVGVAVGTFAAMAYRTIYLVVYLNRNIQHRRMMLFVKNLIVDGIIIMLVGAVTHGIKMSTLNYLAWLMMAIKISLIAGMITIIVNLCFYRKYMLHAIRAVVGVLFRHR